MKPLIVKKLLAKTSDAFMRTVVKRQDRESMYQQIQRQLINQYRGHRLQGINPYPRIADAGFRCYSQFEEDGIILFVLAMIGFKTRRVVEMCCGDATECMATNLILNHGFDGVLYDGNEQGIEDAGAFFKSKKDCLLYQPTLRHAWITAENVNQLLSEAGAAGEVDLFSLDVDGNDYWIWDAIEVMQPRLCVFETHNVIPEPLSLTIRYQPDFSFRAHPGAESDYRSVSLAAMSRLCKRKGYRLIGAHRHGFNAFFLRQDIEPEMFPEVSIAQVHDNHWTRYSQEVRWPVVKGMDWVEV